MFISSCDRRSSSPAVAHHVFSIFSKSMGLVADESDDHAVEVKEEHEEMEAEFDE